MGWITDNAPLPDFMLPLVIGYTGKGITHDIVAIYPSKQQWDAMRSDEKSDFLELVEWLGQDIDLFIRHMEAMLPKNPGEVNGLRIRIRQTRYRLPVRHYQSRHDVSTSQGNSPVQGL